jgi:pilus assembly protein CpaE
MMSDTVASIALIEPSFTNRETLRNVIQAVDWVVVEAECTQYEQALSAFTDTHFDGAIIGLDEEPAKGLELVGLLADKYPDVPIAVVASRPEWLVRAHRQGARSLLEYPLQLEHLLTALRSFGSGFQNRPTKGKIITVLSSRGGVGCTTLAVNLATTLATLPNNQVALIDLDLSQGASDIALGLDAEGRLMDLAQNIDSVALQTMKNVLTRHETGLMLLSRPTDYRDISHLHEDHVQRIVRLLQVLSTHVVIDLSKGWLPTDMQALYMADAILLVIQPDLVSLRNAVWMLNSLTAQQMENRVYVVMNRVGAFFGTDSVTIKKAEEVMGRLVYWQVPNDYKPMTEAWNTGVPLVKSAPSSRAHQSIAALAHDLCGRLDPTEAAKDGTTKKKATTVIQPRLAVSS